MQSFLGRALSTLVLALAALSSSCATTSTRDSTTAFTTRHQASYRELTAMLEAAGWLIQDEEYGFHHDPRGLVGDRYELERTDSHGLATLFVFTAERGNGSVMVDVSERVSDGRMYDLFDGLRELFDAAPGWRDPGVVFCTDHDPRHIAEYTGEDDLGRAQTKLRAQSGCSDLHWNEPRE
jgi:hypothetical protein